MDPQPRLGIAHLSHLAYRGETLQSQQLSCLNALFRDDNASAALMDLSVIAQIHGNREMGLEWQDKALAKHRAFCVNQCQGPQPRVLVFAEAIDMGGNTPIEFLLMDSGFEVITLYPSDTMHPAELPHHEVAFCAARADRPTAQEFFATVRRLTLNSGKPVLNLPDTLIQPERDVLQTLFADTPGLRTARTARFSRTELVASLQTQSALHDAVGAYPVIIRPLGSHAGIGLVKLSSSEDLDTYLAQRDETAFFVSEFINYASPQDGLFRKQRVVFVDGKSYPAHMAISDRWDLWYMNAGMDTSADKRAEEAAFMDNFATFQSRHATALKVVNDAFDLHYLGIDCAEDRDGNLVVFEVDNALIVHNMEPAALYPYKGAHMRRLFDAFEAMLLRAI
ncbi:ATP-grasp domain-containing protein [Shimia haliotis]|uniref:Glutathione synthase/RimK-type ligase, ATP-grasp superfamily n=1 Tax=Shimia haliotis TaxID=1280847 RepID=A0A1I4BE03_9RHOB|nr:hypothetical protein [Shimia haliotis]SFK66259.1 Glutathione synthase/RimK-type ligase, ATP-grasp superfamily [Shimia haliotis]